MSCTLVRNGTLIDGTGRDPVPDAGVLIDGDRIRAAGPLRTLPAPDADTIEIDARGGAILPGFIDAHVHVMLDGFDVLRVMDTPLSFPFYAAIGALRRTLESGVTSVRDAAGADAGVKLALDQGVIAGPRLQTSITALTITGGHGDGWSRSGNEFNLFPAHPGRPDGRCDGIDGVRRKVREVLRAGAGVIKVHATGGVLNSNDDPRFTQFSPEELSVIVREAACRGGVRVMAHAQGAEGIKNAVRAGAHSIEHGIYLDGEAIGLMLDRGTILVPTLLAPVAVIEAAEAAQALPEEGVRRAHEVLDAHRESIARAHRAGVRIAMGTDAGIIPHGASLRELSLLCDIGMTPMEAIVASTRVAAECLGWDDRLGTLEAGKVADIVVAGIDPLADIRGLARPERIVLVMQGGRIVKDLLETGAPVAAA